MGPRRWGPRDGGRRRAVPAAVLLGSPGVGVGDRDQLADASDRLATHVSDACSVTTSPEAASTVKPSPGCHRRCGSRGSRDERLEGNTITEPPAGRSADGEAPAQVP